MLEDEIKEKQRVNRERKTNRRYKMVKFFGNYFDMMEKERDRSIYA
jgi:hypothetical protein